MGFFSTVLGFFGFGVGVTLGLVIGYYMFIYFQPTDVKHPVIRPLVELGTESLESMLPEIPHWVRSPDFDRIDWLNKFVETMWPYLDKAICKTAKEIAKPIIAENTAKYKIDSVEFETLTLGSLPPTFQGMKVYTTDEQELIMEPSIKWAGNPNITVVVKAFGLKATAQVIDLQVFALPRITLKPLVPSFPCFAKILVSLMEKPHVDFGLKLLGADLMAIPGLYAFVQIWILQETIKTQVANMYLWPKVLEVQIMDPAKAQKKPVGILHVNVVRAIKLTKKDLMGKSDPYVKLKLTEEKLPSKKTSVKRSNLNPEWNEDFKLVVKDPESQALELTVYDWEQVGKHDKIGMNVIPLKDLTPDETKSVTLNLLKTMDANDPSNEKFRGQLTVDVTYKPFKEGDSDVDTSDESGVIEKAPDGTPEGGGLLVVIVHEAQDVEGKHHTNPYVRILFRGEEKKTKHIKKNRDPRWEEEFQFMCEEPPINDKMQVEVISRPSSLGIHSKENLGYVVISLADVINNKRINEKYHLIDSKNGRIQLELKWKTS
ncbi:synaptotagmin-2-like isoform X1 [Phragmites australis]|uniref:synaptotagmin-2-like isoform X1 n=1 Tax=Phragmites australis TaxID=29695 RepID=UPI002D7A244B|nr:synaptotagmin-2-like isoform X1 [Phragmites australis]